MPTADAWRTGAKRFALAADVLNARAQHLQSGMPGGSRDPAVLRAFEEELACMFTEITLRAFAVELFLKARLVRCSVSPPRSHDLSELFRMLPQNEKAILDRLFDEEFERLFPGSARAGCDSLDALLAESAKAFDEWRYAHEYRPTSAQPGALRIAFEILERRIHDAATAKHEGR